MKTYSFFFVCLFVAFLSTATLSQWVQQTAPGLPNSSDPQVVFSPVDDNVCWGINYTNSQFLRTTDGGDNWNVSTVTAGLRCSGVTAIDANTAWVTMKDPSGVTSGGIFKTIDGGLTWDKQETAFQGTGGNPNAIRFFDIDNGVCIGNPRDGYWEIYSTTNGGSNWIRVDSGNIPTPLTDEVGIEHRNVNGVGNIFWFHTLKNSLYKSTDHGYTWTRTSPVFGVDAIGFAFAFKDSLNGLACDFYPDRKLSRTTDGGVTWIPIDPLPSGLLNLSPVSIAYAKGTAGSYVITAPNNLGGVPAVSGFAYSTDGGFTWTAQVNNVEYGPAAFSDWNTGWAGGINNTIWKWDSDILHPGPWHYQQAISLPNSADPQVVFSVVDDNICWGFSLLNNQFLKTTNGGNGNSWTVLTVTNSSGLQGQGMSALDVNTAWIAMRDPSYVTSGGIFKTADGGTTWAKQTTAFPVPGGSPRVIHFFDSNNGLCAGDPRNGEFEIYTTTNGGDNWIPVPGANIPNPVSGELAAAQFSAQGIGNYFWFNTTKAALYRTTDKGYTWSVTRPVINIDGRVPFAFKDSLNGLACTFVGGNKISRTTDGGTTWVPLTLPTALDDDSISTFFIEYAKGTAGAYVITSHNNFNGINPAVPGSAYTNDDGNTWTYINNTPLGPAAFSDWNTGWAGGVNDIVYEWESDLLVTSVNEIDRLPEAYFLEQNYPNPFNPSTTIRYSIPEGGLVTIKVYDVLGNEVTTLVNEEKPAGSYEVEFRSHSGKVRNLSSGVYFYALQAGNFIQTKKLILMK